MPRITRAALTPQLEASRAECAQLRQHCAEWACQSRADRITILKLKSQVPAQAPNTTERQHAIDRYMAAHPGAKSVTIEQLREFATQH